METHEIVGENGHVARVESVFAEGLEEAVMLGLAVFTFDFQFGDGHRLGQFDGLGQTVTVGLDRVAAGIEEKT